VTTINLVIGHQYGDDKTLRDIISETMTTDEAIQEAAQHIPVESLQ